MTASMSIVAWTALRALSWASVSTRLSLPNGGLFGLMFMADL